VAGGARGIRRKSRAAAHVVGGSQRRARQRVEHMLRHNLAVTAAGARALRIPKLLNKRRKSAAISAPRNFYLFNNRRRRAAAAPAAAHHHHPAALRLILSICVRRYF
jgi:hypothetical protein